MEKGTGKVTYAADAGEEEERKPKKPQTPLYIDLSEALSFWIVITVIALILDILVNDTGTIQSGTAQAGFLISVYQFFLFGPGVALLPLIAGAVIGIDVGRKSKNATNTLKVGLVNSVYGALIYLIAIIVLYEVYTFALPHSPITQNQLLMNWIALPIGIFIVTSVVLALVSVSRKL
jgi:hypothetical protein